MVCAAKWQPSKTTFFASDFPMEAPAPKAQKSGFHEWASLFFVVPAAEETPWARQGPPSAAPDKAASGAQRPAHSSARSKLAYGPEIHPVDKPVEGL